jgi:putative toxin-antitoxin system antitoxin component (TIGR02293 family)
MGQAAFSRFSPSEIRSGLSFHELEQVLRVLGLSHAEAASFLLISERTLARRRREGRLNQAESDRLVRISQLLDETRDAFDGDFDAAVEWLMSEKTLLRGETPLQHADTEPGYEAVREMLSVIQYNTAA